MLSVEQVLSAALEELRTAGAESAASIGKSDRWQVALWTSDGTSPQGMKVLPQRSSPVVKTEDTVATEILSSSVRSTRLSAVYYCTPFWSRCVGSTS